MNLNAERKEKIKTIAREYVLMGTDNRTYPEVLDHMLDWFDKGWLNHKWVDTCFDAIHSGKTVVFNFSEQGYMWLSGESEAQIRDVLSRVDLNKVEVKWPKSKK